MANELVTPTLTFEYYIDYIDPIPVDEKTLLASKDSIVIIFWVSLAAFVLFLFLILIYMSWPGSLWARLWPARPWSWGLQLPLWVRRQRSRALPQLLRGSKEQSTAQP